MTASPDRPRNARNTGSSVDTSLRAVEALTVVQTQDVALEMPSDRTVERKRTGARDRIQKLSFLNLSSFVATTTADIFSILAVSPFVLFTGPDQTDTAFGIIVPVTILCLAPLIGATLAAKLQPSFLALSSCGARLVIASSLFGNLGGVQMTANTIFLSIAFIWGLRLQEVSASPLDKTKTGRIFLYTYPLLALLAVLKFFEQLQPSFMPTALSLYAVGLVLLGLDQIIARIRTTGNTVQNDLSNQSDTTADAENNKTVQTAGKKAFTTEVYEVLLSVMAAVLPVASVILVITDQGLPAPMLRYDVLASLAGFSIGAVATAIISQKYWFKITHLHMAFVGFLGILLISRTSILALSALLFTSVIAGAITMTVNQTRWQKPVTLSLLVLAAYFSYLYLTPFQSTWMPIHALRMLVGNMLIVSVAALFVSTRGRATIIALVRKISRAKNSGGAFNTSSDRGI